MVHGLTEEKTKITLTRITLTLGSLYAENIGKKGTIVISAFTNLEFNIIDTTKSVFFKSNIINGQSDEYEVDCGFWKAKNDRLYMFCNIGENIPAGNYILNPGQTSGITYDDYSINFYQKTTLQFEKKDTNIIDLYSDEQTITLEKDKDIYDLTFKISSYNQEKIMLNYSVFPDCRQESNELLCQVTKNQLESMIMKNESSLAITYISDFGRSEKFPLIPMINVIDNINEKTDVYVGIKRLIENVAEFGTLIAYETNVTNIDNILMDFEAFKLPFSNNIDEDENCDCSFRKYDDTPLLIICFINIEGTNWLKEITEEIIIDEKNIK